MGGHLAIKPVEKILFDDRKLRAADRVDVVISEYTRQALMLRLRYDGVAHPRVEPPTDKAAARP